MSEAQTVSAPKTLAEKLAAAKAAAATSIGAPAPAANTTAVATAPAGGVPAKASNAAAVLNTFSVDGYIKASKEGYGLQIDGVLLTDPIDVLIDFKDVIPHQAIKAGSNPTRYDKSYDGVMAKSGKTWTQAIEDMQKLDPKARPYDSYDVCLVPVSDVVLKDKVLAKAGARLGYATPTTGKTAWVNFCKRAAEAGVDIDRGKVFAKIFCEKKTGNGNTWGVMGFEFIAPYTEQ